jgi:hypothetical protein
MGLLIERMYTEAGIAEVVPHIGTDLDENIYSDCQDPGTCVEFLLKNGAPSTYLDAVGPASQSMRDLLSAFAEAPAVAPDRVRAMMSTIFEGYGVHLNWADPVPVAA